MSIEIAEIQHELEMERLDRTLNALDEVAMNISIEIAEFLASELGILEEWKVFNKWKSKYEPF